MEPYQSTPREPVMELQDALEIFRIFSDGAQENKVIVI